MTADDVFDPSRAHSARMYAWLLGEKDHYDTDQLAAERVLHVFPHARRAARANRQFMVRSTRYLARHGIDQFLDIGAGLPTEVNLHQVARKVHPDARVVYVDNNPVVLAHARALLASDWAGRVDCIDADLTDPASILNSERLRASMDLSRPVALSMNAVLHFIPDRARPYEIVHTLLAALAPGSYLTLTHATGDFDPERIAAVAAVCLDHGIEVRARTHAEFARFLTGLDLIEPGITVPHRWNPRLAPVPLPAPASPAAATTPEAGQPDDAGVAGLFQRRDARTSLYAAVARIPAPPAGWR